MKPRPRWFFLSLGVLATILLAAIVIYTLPRTPAFVESLVRAILLLEAAGFGWSEIMDVILVCLVMLLLAVAPALAMLTRWLLRLGERALWGRTTIKVVPQTPLWNRVLLLVLTWLVSMATVRIL